MLALALLARSVWRPYPFREESLGEKSNVRPETSCDKFEVPTELQKLKTAISLGDNDVISVCARRAHPRVTVSIWLPGVRP